VRAALARHLDALGEAWKPFPETLAGHAYIARRVLAPDLTGINLFLLLAAAAPDARAHMGDYTLLVTGASFAGKPGFILLADRADPLHGDFGSSESLQDHACALAAR
jgi:CDP-diacylglycerol pyrophosphatase